MKKETLHQEGKTIFTNARNTNLKYNKKISFYGCLPLAVSKLLVYTLHWQDVIYQTNLLHANCEAANYAPPDKPAR